ncbi:MAG: hypothetical protein ILP19_04630 [Oscillospiraceae bacterium]|nr:hypothetical protein [Oscillospiraceae bacterium]
MKKNIFEELEEAKKEQRAEELRRDSEYMLERAKKDETERKEYADKLRQEQLELKKLKQGLISEDEIPKEEEAPKKVYTFREKVSNFFYHYKFHVIAASVVVVIVAILAYDYLSAERPDVQAIFIADDYEMTYRADRVKPVWSQYTQDYNRDRKQIAKLYYIPTNYSDPDNTDLYFAQADRTKLIGEFQSGNTIIFIGNMEAYTMLGVEEGVFVDAREIFPDDENAEKIGYRLSGTDFKELIDYPELDDSKLYVSFRQPVKTFGMSEEEMRKNYDEAVEFWRAYLSEHRK